MGEKTCKVGQSPKISSPYETKDFKRRMVWLKALSVVLINKNAHCVVVAHYILFRVLVKDPYKMDLAEKVFKVLRGL